MTTQKELHASYPAAFAALDDPSDSELLRQFRNGDEAAATQLYERYSRRLLRLTEGKQADDLSGRFDPDDIVQSVFRSFFRRARTALYDVPDGAELWPLLLVIALHKIRSRGAFHRAAKRDVRREYPLPIDQAEPQVIEKLSSREPQPFLCLVALETLEQLSTPQRQVVEWRLEGFGVAEIAERAGRSKRSIERILKECRRQLSQLLPEEVCDAHGS
jgi:RNA polymerase sigma-70 factor (ECF subfamily)